MWYIWSSSIRLLFNLLNILKFRRVWRRWQIKDFQRPLHNMEWVLNGFTTMTRFLIFEHNLFLNQILFYFSMIAKYLKTEMGLDYILVLELPYLFRFVLLRIKFNVWKTCLRCAYHLSFFSKQCMLMFYSFLLFLSSISKLNTNTPCWIWAVILLHSLVDDFVY